MRFLCLTLLALALPGEPDASGTIREFYSKYTKLKVSGLPNAAQLTAMSPYLSPSLQLALKKAQTQQAACLKAHPDEKPLWIEGEMFASSFEGFTSILSIAEAGNNAFDIQFEYLENGQKIHWTDRVLLVQLPAGKWAIDDFQYRDGARMKAAFHGKGC